MPLYHVHLELARTPEVPSGSRAHGYDLVLPLHEDGHLDPNEWRQSRKLCTVARFWPGQNENGHLIHSRSGAWAFSYAPGEEDDEPVYRLADHVFSEGEYVSVREHDGVTRPFRVLSVRKREG